MIASYLCVVGGQTKVSHRALRGFRHSTGRVENPQKTRLSEARALVDYVMNHRHVIEHLKKVPLDYHYVITLCHHRESGHCIALQ